MFDAPPPDYADLARTDRELARAWEIHRRRGSLEGCRTVAGKRAWDALGELLGGGSAARAAPEHARMHVEAQRRWVGYLTCERIAEPAEVELAHLADEPEVTVELETAVAMSYPDAIRALVAAREPARRRRLLAAVAERARELAPRAALADELRHEAASRLPGHDPFASALGAPAAPVVARAEALLVRLRPLVRDLVRAEEKRLAAAVGPADFVAMGAAREAGVGWPARLSTRSLVDVFRGPLRDLAGRAPLEAAELPAIEGASSFARGLELLGARTKDAGAAKSLPFALARDPFSPEGWALGAAFASLVVSPAFHRRALGLGAAAARDQARRLVVTALFEAEKRAIAALVAAAGADRYEELTTNAFGAPLPSSLARLVPRLRGGHALVRFTALLRGALAAASLVDRYDEDWFENPRAGVDLAHLASAPARGAAPSDEELGRAVDLVVRTCEEALA